MRVLLAHVRYRQAGGEDVVFASERDVLRDGGHEVIELLEDNAAVAGRSAAALALEWAWSRHGARRVARALEQCDVDVVHFHNTFHRLSPAALRTASAAGVPVVATLHNYRLACPVATLHRGAGPCTDCVGRIVAWPGILHGCHRGSRAGTAAVAAGVALHRALGTWRHAVDRWILLSDYQRRLLSDVLPEDRVTVKPNFLAEDPGAGTGEGEHVLHVGRLAPEKGTLDLLEAWSSLPDVPLLVVGTGPQEEEIRRRAASMPHVQVLGRLSRERVLELLRAARFVVLPSMAAEAFPLVLLESFASGRPVLASRLGAMEELVEDGVTGWHFRVGDPADLARVARRAWDEAATAAALGRTARRLFERQWSPVAGREALLAVYEQARAAARSRREA